MYLQYKQVDNQIQTRQQIRLQSTQHKNLLAGSYLILVFSQRKIIASVEYYLGLHFELEAYCYFGGYYQHDSQNYLTHYCLVYAQIVHSIHWFLNSIFALNKVFERLREGSCGCNLLQWDSSI
ncbi:Hypothetical_protein [Hexamita inflata]|uniref:Hypothetical_protein n=1 Tax=Hexamita inflata TaxID=28002 RepID=A0AA86TTU3_9EUKA|nr:Hypothetical protein HINF_LOCUS16199 [Hexamita inflata]